MQTAETDFPRVEYFLDSWHKRHADTVAQLNQVKAKSIFDFAQHHIAVSMTSGIPTRGKGDHFLTSGQQTGSISGAGAGEIGRSQTWRPARLNTEAAAIA